MLLTWSVMSSSNPRSITTAPLQTLPLPLPLPGALSALYSSPKALSSRDCLTALLLSRSRAFRCSKISLSASESVPFAYPSDSSCARSRRRIFSA